MDRFSFERRGEKECRRGEDRDFAPTWCDMRKNVMEIWCDMEKNVMEIWCDMEKNPWKYSVTLGGRYVTLF